MTAFDRRVISREAFEERYRANPGPAGPGDDSALESPC
jgi:hypothetical protein